MSLVAWYPLISNMNNQGVGDADLTVSTTPTFVPGLIGGALQGGGSATWTATQTANILNNTAMSFCFWVYPDAATGDTGARARFFGNDSPRHYSIFQYPTCNDLHWDWRNNAGSTVLGGVLSGVLPSYKWTHVTFTYQNPTFKIYINGVLKHTASASLDVQSYANATPVILACSGRKLCDYRVYTNCLSALEVKQISQALLLHYPMTGGGRGQDNLVPNQAKFTSVNPKTLTTTATDGNSWLSGSAFEVKPSTTYTYSVCCDGQIATKHATDGSEPGTFSMWLYLCNDGTTKNWQGGAYDSPVCFTSSNYNHKQVGNRHIWQYTTTSTQRYMSIRLNNYGPGTVTNNYWEFKIEESPKFTPYLPNVNESEYTAMGYNDNTEYDTSGYLHNGTINGNVSYSSDSARYSVSTEFVKAGYINVPSFNVDTSAFTLNFWVKMKTATSQHFVLGTFTSWTNNGIGVYRDANAEWYSCLIRSAGESTYKAFSLYPTVGSWHMLTLTYDGIHYKGYLNGVLKQNATYGSGGVVSNPVFMVGNSKFNGTPSSENEEAFVSDVRFYATCLDQEDITKLYNTSASLANNGTLMAYEFTEM